MCPFWWRPIFQHTDVGEPSHLWLSPVFAAVLELHPWETHHCRHWTRASIVTSHLTSQFPSGAMSSSTDVFKIMKQKHALLTALDASPVCACLSLQNRVLKHAPLSFSLQIRKHPPWLTVEKKRKALEALRSFEIFHQVVLWILESPLAWVEAANLRLISWFKGLLNLKRDIVLPCQISSGLGNSFTWHLTGYT